MASSTATKPKPQITPKTSVSPARDANPSREAIFDLFRRWGYLQASLDPLGQFYPPEPFPTSAPESPASDEARRIYCSSIGAEFMHISSPKKREWIQQQLEGEFTAANPGRILTGLIRADLFE